MPKPTRAMGGLGELRHSRDVGIRLDDIIQKNGGSNDALLQGPPIHARVRSAVLVEID